MEWYLIRKMLPSTNRMINAHNSAQTRTALRSKLLKTEKLGKILKCQNAAKLIELLSATQLIHSYLLTTIRWIVQCAPYVHHSHLAATFSQLTNRKTEDGKKRMKYQKRFSKEWWRLQMGCLTFRWWDPFIKWIANSSWCVAMKKKKKAREKIEIIESEINQSVPVPSQAYRWINIFIVWQKQ